MKIFIKHVLFILFLLILTRPDIYGQMIYIGLKDEANIQNSQKELYVVGGYWPKTQILDDYLYIPTVNGLYRKNLNTLNNTDWELYAFEGIAIRDFIKNNNTILATTTVYSDKNLLLLSTDDGNSYRDYTHPYFWEHEYLSKSEVVCLVQNPENSNTILTTSGIGVSVSFDFGENWTSLFERGASWDAFLDYNPHDTTNIFLATKSDNMYGYLYVTYNNGGYWQETTEPFSPRVIGVAFHPVDKNTMIRYGYFTFKSTDQGLTWNKISLDFITLKMVYDKNNPEILYAADYSSVRDMIKIFRSTDGGGTWHLFYKEAILLSEGVVDLHLYDNKLIVYTLVNGVYYLDLDNIPEIKYEYVPTVKENTQWSYCNLIEEGTAGEKTPYYSYMYFDGDTIMDEITYKKLYNYYCPTESLSYVAAMREEDKKVYALRKDINEQEVLLYDYSLEVGESYELEGYTYEVTKIDTIEVADKLRKRFFFDSYSVPIIEGIGALHTYFFYDIFGPIVPENDLYLNFYKENGTTTYRTYEWFFSEKECPAPVVNLKNSTHPDQILLMNPIKDQLMFNVDLLDKTYQLEVIDLYGRVVLQNMVSKERNSVSVANMNNGLYLYRLTTNGGIFYQGKVVKSN